MEVGALWFNTQFTIGRAPHYFRLKSLTSLNPSYQVDFENDQYQVKTVNCVEELAQVLSLRFEVFFREFSTQKVTFSLFPYDVDMHDFVCDHLIVKDKSLNKVVACYRLLSTNTERSFKHFYSEGEFQIDELLNAPGHKLELGRACVHKDYRKGAVISLLWKGLIDYARKSNTRYMFGCSSINRKDFANVSQMMEQLDRQNNFINKFEVGVQAKYRLKFELPQSEEASGKAMGSLMHMYLMAGAKLGRTLAYDAEMDCLDMFTLMDMQELPASFERRFA